MNFSYHFDGGAFQLIHSEEIMKFSILVLSLYFTQTVPSFALGDKSVLPASSDAMTGTVRALNQVQPEEEVGKQEAEEEPEVLGPRMCRKSSIKRIRDAKRKRKKLNVIASMNQNKIRGNRHIRLPQSYFIFFFLHF